MQIFRPAPIWRTFVDWSIALYVPQGNLSVPAVCMFRIRDMGSPVIIYGITACDVGDDRPWPPVSSPTRVKSLDTIGHRCYYSVQGMGARRGTDRLDAQELWAPSTCFRFERLKPWKNTCLRAYFPTFLSSGKRTGRKFGWVKIISEDPARAPEKCSEWTGVEVSVLALLDSRVGCSPGCGNRNRSRLNNG